jgi:hypothetical protein
MFAFAQPTYHQYNPYQDLTMQQELQRRRQIEAYLRRQQQVEEMERRQREYEAAVRRAEYERRRQAELQRRRQTQQARTRHSMYDGGLEALFDALYGAQGRRQEVGSRNGMNVRHILTARYRNARRVLHYGGPPNQHRNWNLCTPQPMPQCQRHYLRRRP